MTNGSLNLAKYCLEASVCESPDKCALRIFTDGGRLANEWTYREIHQSVLGVAGYLSKLNFPKSSRILLRIGNTSDFPLMFLGSIAAGFVPVPTSSMLTERECDHLLADSDSVAVVHDGKTVLPAKTGPAVLLGPEIIEEMKTTPPGQFANTLENDPAFLVYTSGTSGKPKGVLHAQRSLPGRKPMYEHWYGISANDILLHTGAFNWTYTLGAGLMDPWVNGATSIIFTGESNPEIWPEILKISNASLFASVPSLYRRILKYGNIYKDSFPNLRHCLTAGESLSAQLHEDWVSKTGKPLYEAFGMSEISTYISSGPTVPVKPGSPGKFQAGRKYAILPVDGGVIPQPTGKPGVIAIDRDETGLMLGYWKMQSESDSGFRGRWFLTGDTGCLDEDGYFWFSGRSDEVMNAFGYRVAPQEVEKILSEHPEISESAVAQVNVREGVDIIAAFIVPEPDKNIDVGKLSDWCSQRIADYKCPKKFKIVDSLPRTPSGKVQKKKLAVAASFTSD